LIGLRMLQCGRWFRLTLCGVFGGKEMIEILRIANRW